MTKEGSLFDNAEAVARLPTEAKRNPRTSRELQALQHHMQSRNWATSGWVRNRCHSYTGKVAPCLSSLRTGRATVSMLQIMREKNSTNVHSKSDESHDVVVDIDVLDGNVGEREAEAQRAHPPVIREAS